MYLGHRESLLPNQQATASTLSVIHTNFRTREVLIYCTIDNISLFTILQANKIFQQIDENDLSTEESDFWDILEVELSGTCKSYYTKWMQMNERFPHIFRKAFYGSEKDIKYFYQANVCEMFLNKGRHLILIRSTLISSHMEPKEEE